MSAGKALALGAISGLRFASGPAFVGRAANRGDMDLDGTTLAFVGSPRLSKALTLAQLGELIGDKLPTTPSRTAWPPILGRAVSGGLVGAAAFLSEGRHAATGAILGSSAAVAAAFAGENLRALVVKRIGLPDPVVAVAEDAVVLVVGSRASSTAASSGRRRGSTSAKRTPSSVPTRFPAGPRRSKTRACSK